MARRCWRWSDESAQGYTEYTFDVVGTAPTSHLEFDFRQDPSHWSLDSISVTAVGSQAPAAPVISTFSPDSDDANVLTLSGMAAAGSTVKVYDRTTLLGTTTANSSGAWSSTTGTLSNTTHSFTATATDAAGNTSATSAPLVVTWAPSVGQNLVVNGSFETGDFHRMDAERQCCPSQLRTADISNQHRPERPECGGSWPRRLRWDAQPRHSDDGWAALYA